MASLDQTAFSAALKTLYPSEEIKRMTYENNPFFALVPKDEGFYGDSSKEPIMYGLPQNRSASFSAAATVNSTTALKAFLLTRVSNYATASIANETILASQNDKGAFLRAAKMEIDNALFGLSRAIATQLFRSGTGTVGQISASATVNSSSTMVVLSQPEDIVNLEVGMSIALSATDGGAVRSGTAYIVSIDRMAGSFLCAATVGGSAAALTSLITGAAASDYIYAAAADRNAVISGIKAWLPGSAVTSSTFFGVDRTADKTRLAGITYDGSALTPEEAIIEGARLAAREGGRPDHVFVSFLDFAKLVRSLGSKVQYTQAGAIIDPKVTVGFQALQLAAPHGMVKVVPDQNAPAGSAYLLQLDTWKLRSLGEVVSLFDTDGRVMLRDSSSDSVSIRCVSYAQLSCRAPGWNAVVTMP